MNTKVCTKCKLEKSFDCFYVSRVRKSGFDPHCRQCHRDYRKNNSSEISKRQKEYYKQNKSQFKDYELSKAYGISIDEYNSLLAKQNGVCAICKTPETSKNNEGSVRNLAVDHDHRSGRVRGLVCMSCNTSLGLFKDNTTFLFNAAQYLQMNHENLLVAGISKFLAKK